jgi:hypothetical protein
VGGLPTGQPVAAFAADPTEHPVLFAALPNGVWASRDRSASWQPLSGAPGGITAFAVHPGRAGTVFVGTGEGRIFESRDSGASWQLRR